MSIIGSCGHRFTEEEGMGNSITIKDWDDGKKCIASICICDECLKWYKKHRRILKNDAAIDKWMGEGFSKLLDSGIFID
jgi:hypothetical protein